MKFHSRLFLVLSALTELTRVCGSLCHFSCGDVTPILTNDSLVEDFSFTMQITSPIMTSGVELVDSFQYKVRIHSTVQTSIAGMDFSTNLTQNISKKDNEESISQSGSGVCQIRHDVINLPLTFNWTSPDSNASCISLTTKLVLNVRTWTLLSTTICRPKECRKYLITGKNVITSENYPSSYPDGHNCVYIIYLAPSETIHLQFEEFDIEDPYLGRCLDYVSIVYDNSTIGPLCGKLKGDDLKTMHFVTKGNSIKIEFVSDSKISSQGFRAVYQSSHVRECNSTWTSLHGEISSPGYPSLYYPNLFCAITVTLPATYRILLVVLELHLGHLESQTSCAGDMLQIQDTSSNRSLVTWCRLEDTTRTFESSGSFVNIFFSSDHILQGKGFRLRYHGILSCNNQTFNASHGVLDSVNFPQHYPNSQHCFYTITTTSDTIELTFKHFHTESGAAADRGLRDAFCDRDYVEIYVDNKDHRVCGNWTGREHLLLFRSFGNKIVFKFVSNELDTRTGFYGSWRVIENSEETQCLSQILDTQHDRFEIVFSSQTWGDGEFDCRSRGGHLAKIADIATQILISEHLLESNCSRTIDTFWIGANDRKFESDFYWTDGSKVSYTNWFPGWSMYGYTNSEPSDDGYSNEDCVEMRRRFHYPYKGTGKSDTFYWNDRNCMAKNPYICQCYKNGKQPVAETPIGCNKSITLQNSSDTFLLQSPDHPNTYPNFMDCFIFIQAPEYHSIIFEFAEFNLESDERYDFLWLSSFPWSSNLTGNRMCGNWTDKTKLLMTTIRSSFVFVKFKSDHSLVFPGFKVTISTHNASSSNSSDLMNSALNPAGYSQFPAEHSVAEMKCKHLRGRLCPMESQEEVVFLTSQLPRHPDVRKLWVENTIMNNSVSGTPSPCLALHVRVTETYENATYASGYQSESVPCEDQLPYVCCSRKTENVQRVLIYNASSGSILNPIPPNSNYSNFENTTYILVADDRYRISMTLTNIDLEYQKECLYDYLIITNTTSDGRYCHSSQQRHFISLQNHTTLTFITDYSVTGSGFALSWRWVDPSQCQAHINTDESGNVTSFNYPYVFPDAVRCTTVLTAAKNKRLFMEFVYLKLSDDGGCNYSYVEVWTGGNQHHRLCRNTNTSLYDMSFVSLENTLKIVFVSRQLERNDGFILTYRKLSVPSVIPPKTFYIQPGTDFELKNLNSPYGFPKRLEQTIVFRAPIGHVIGVNFTTLQLAQSVQCNDATLVLEDTSLGAPRLVRKLCASRHSDKTSLPQVWSHLHRLKLTVNSAWNNTGTFTERFSATVFAVSDPEYLKKTIHETTFDVCGDSQPCLHEGVCIQDNTTQARCLCVGYYTGLFCQVTKCEAGFCNNGNCTLHNDSYTCSCFRGYWGYHCSVDALACRSQFCRQNGYCVGDNTTSPRCVCDTLWKGNDCSGRIPKVSPAIGERLLGEPIWVGLIVILTVVLAFGIFWIVRRKCLKRYKCCQIETKKKEIMTEPASNQSYPMGILRSLTTDVNSHQQLNVSSASEATHKIEDTGSSTGTSTPIVHDNGADVAAKFFASYREAEKMPIAPQVAVDFSKNTATSMSTGPEDESSVGTLLTGALTLAFSGSTDIKSDEKESSYLSPSTRRHLAMKKSQSVSEEFVRQPAFVESQTEQLIRSKSVSAHNLSHIYPTVIISSPDSYNTELTHTDDENLHPSMCSPLQINVRCSEKQLYNNSPIRQNSHEGIFHLSNEEFSRDFLLATAKSTPILNRYLSAQCQRTPGLKQRSASFDVLKDHPSRMRNHQNSLDSENNTICECRMCRSYSERKYRRYATDSEHFDGLQGCSHKHRANHCSGRDSSLTKRRRAQYQNSKSAKHGSSSHSTVSKECNVSMHKSLCQVSSSESENSRKYYSQRRVLNKARASKLHRSVTCTSRALGDKLGDNISRNDMFQRIFSQEIVLDSDDDPSGFVIQDNSEDGQQYSVQNNVLEKTASPETRTCSVIMYDCLSQDLCPILESQPTSRTSLRVPHHSIDTEQCLSESLLQDSNQRFADKSDSALNSSTGSTHTSPVDVVGGNATKLSVQKKYSSDNSVKDSAYQTKQSSVEVSTLDMGAEWSSRRRLCAGSTKRYEDRKVDHRLRQTAIKLHKLQNRQQRRKLSRDSAIDTPSAETSDIGSSLDSNLGQILHMGRTITKVPVNSYESTFQASLASSQESTENRHSGEYILDEYPDLNEVTV